MMKTENRILRLTFSVIVFFILSLPVSAVNNDSLIIKGNRFYDKGLYNDAIEQYNKVIDNGYQSAKLFYNLGNAYFKLNDMASAILNYERAKKLDPNNKDIIFNLKIANSRIPDKIEAVPTVFYKKWWNTFYNMFSVNTWAKIAIGTLIITLILIAVYFISHSRITKKFSFWFGILFLLVTIFAFIISSQKYYYTKAENEAIVFTPAITVKSSPSKNSVDLFVIHEGTKVEITDEVKDWYEIKIANGSIGWLPAEAVKTI